jgi:hypothetical protein
MWAPDWHARFHPDEADHIDLDKIAEVLSVFIHSSLDATLMAELPHLRMIATRSTNHPRSTARC